jgi:hypothetical protein
MFFSAPFGFCYWNKTTDNAVITILAKNIPKRIISIPDIQKKPMKPRAKQ